MPVVPLNAKNDRVYFQRYSSETPESLTNASSPWLILKIQLGQKLRAEPNDVFILPWKHSHLLDHKYLFTPQSFATTILNHRFCISQRYSISSSPYGRSTHGQFSHDDTATKS